MMGGIISLCPNSTSFRDENSLIHFAKFFNSDTSVLKCAVDKFKRLLQRKADRERVNSLLGLQVYLQKLKEAFFEIHRIAINACALSVSTAECERKFYLNAADRE